MAACLCWLCVQYELIFGSHSLSREIQGNLVSDKKKKSGNRIIRATR